VNATRKSVHAGLLAAAAVLALLVALVAPPREAAAAPASGQEIAEALTCQCGCGLTVANCNHPNCSFSVSAE
jgi:hypothetical protein